MKFKNLFAILLVVTVLTGTLVIPTSAKEPTVIDTEIEIIIYDEVSEETKAKIKKYFSSGEPEIDKGTSTYGLTCTLLGHKTESSVVAATTHKVSATAPRCLKKTYSYEACTRCDYENSTLISSVFIYCCA